MHPFYVIRALGGALFLFGALLMVFNIWMTIAGMRTESVPTGRLAFAPTRPSREGKNTSPFRASAVIVARLSGNVGNGLRVSIMANDAPARSKQSRARRSSPARGPTQRRFRAFRVPIMDVH